MIVPATLASIAIHCVHAHTRCMKMLSVRTLPLVRTFAILAISPKARRSEEHTSELQSQSNLVCRLLLEKKKKKAMSLLPITILYACGLLGLHLTLQSLMLLSLMRQALGLILRLSLTTANEILNGHSRPA